LATFAFAQSSIPITQLVSDHQLIENFTKKAGVFPVTLLKPKEQSSKVEVVK
jgi:hypothetical protein